MSSGSDESDLPLRPADFESIRVELELSNLSSDQELLHGSPLRLLQLFEEGLLFEAPQGFCVPGDSLRLKLSIHGADAAGPVRFQSSLRADKVEASPRGADMITTTLTHYDLFAWERFNQIFRARQQEILEFFSAAKGY